MMSRLSTYNTGMPENYTVLYIIYVDENTFIENSLKLRFEEEINTNNKEWIFGVELHVIIDYIRYICDGTKLKYKEHIFNNQEYLVPQILDNEKQITNKIETEDEVESLTETESEVTDTEDEVESLTESESELTDTEEADTETEPVSTFDRNEVIYIKVTAKTKLEDLQDICKKYNLNSDGLKKDLYERINEFKKLYEEIKDDNSSETEGEDEYEIEEPEFDPLF